MSRSYYWFGRLLVGAAFAGALGVTACSGAAVSLTPTEYSPRLQDQTGSYRGTHLYLVTPVNEAENTSLFYYYATDGSARYGGRALTSYLWYGLEKAFSEVGIVVHEEPPGYPVPELDLTFSSWTDREFVAEARLVSPRPFERMMRVEFASPPPAAATPEQRKAFAYGQLDAIAVGLLGDPEFLASLLAAQPQPSAPAPAMVPVPDPSAPAPDPNAPATAPTPSAGAAPVPAANAAPTPSAGAAPAPAVSAAPAPAATTIPAR